MGRVKDFYFDEICNEEDMNEWETKLKQSKTEGSIIKFLDNFQKFHARNPHIFHAVVKYSDAQRRMRSHYSIENIIGTVRYYTDLNGEGDPFKINNNYKAYYSRMYMQYRNCSGFFELRNSLADDYDFSRSINEYKEWHKEEFGVEVDENN